MRHISPSGSPDHSMSIPRRFAWALGRRFASGASASKPAVVRGDEARDRRDWTVAAKNYRDHLEETPGDLPIWVQLGHALKESGKLTDALAAYYCALRLDPADADLLLNLGHLYKMTGDKTCALVFYKRSLERDGNPDARQELQAIIAGVGATGDLATPQQILAAEENIQREARRALITQSGRAGPSESQPHVGSLEDIHGSRVTGWAYDPRAPNSRATIEFFANGRVLFEGTTSLLREDVRAHGYGDGWMGFSLRVPLDLVREVCAEGDQIALHARLAGTDWELAGSPKLIFLPSANALRETVPVKNVSNWVFTEPPLRLIAFYLPQYHPFEENNAWWGPGFTEWTNVTRADAQFEGHYQPHRPGELGYYDLRVPAVQERQAQLARLFGIGGFCFYFYWFNGKILMEMPIRQFVENDNIDLPFCLCWANENWTRRWDGLDSEILISQKHSREDDLAFIKHVANYFGRENYITVDGKPVLLVYRMDLLPNPARTANIWREYCQSIGIDGLYLVCTQAFSSADPTEFGFDAAVEFPPNMTRVSDAGRIFVDQSGEFSGSIFDYNYSVGRIESFVWPDYHVIRAVFTGWDNTARRRSSATIFINSTADAYLRYLETVSRQVLAREPSPDRRLIFINAWNEWAEGARLEPDELTGYASLEATRMAMIRAGASDPMVRLQRFGALRNRPRLAVIVHAFYLDVLEDMLPIFSEYPLYVEFFFTTAIYQTHALKALLRDFKHKYEILPVENRGRDVAPFLEVLRSVWSRKFQYILKLHTKKSTHREDGDRWRNDMLSHIAPITQVDAILSLLDTDQKIGVVGPKDHILSMTAFWGANAAHVDSLCRRMGMSDVETEKAVFVAGTMFIARLEALEPLMGLSLTTADFEKEDGQVDGTLAHAIERAITFSAAAVGMDVRGASLKDDPSGIISDAIATVYAHAESSVTDA
jgi:lipopolysaccharide biosynthesis protein